MRERNPAVIAAVMGLLLLAGWARSPGPDTTATLPPAPVEVTVHTLP